MITQTYDLNLIPEYATVPLVVKASQYDNGSRTLVFNLWEGDKAFTPPSGVTALIEGTKPDSHGFSYEATISGSTVQADIQRQMTAVTGEVRCELRLQDVDNDIVLGTTNFILYVEAAGMNDETDISETDIPEIVILATAQMNAAIAAAEEALGSAEDSEAWAVGQRDGTDVGSADEAYHNNSKYYSGVAEFHAEAAAASETNAAGSETNAARSETAAEGYAEDAEAWAVGQRDGTDVGSADETYHNNSKYYASQSGASAANAASHEAAASGCAVAAEGYSEDAEAWAVGQRGGADVDPTDETYRNHSKWYSRQSQSYAQEAEGYAEDLEDAISTVATMVGQVRFSVDYSTGNLLYTDDNPYTFAINASTGNLEWEVSA